MKRNCSLSPAASSKKVTRFGRRVLSEALENRTLMSLTVSVVAADGTSAATVTAINQTLTLKVLATITSANNDPQNYYLDEAIGSFISSAVDGHAVAGDLTAATTAPWNGFHATNGVVTDLNGDGNKDVGGTSPTAIAEYFHADPGEYEPPSAGTTSGNSVTFQIGTLTYKVTNLNDGGETDINFVPWAVQAGYADSANWTEQAATEGSETETLNNYSGTFVGGAPFLITDNAKVIAPVAKNDTAAVTRNLSATINVLANDDRVKPLNPASVAISSSPTHGTVAVQTNGTIVYTPTIGYTGTDSFRYNVSDNAGRQSNDATVTLTITAPPPPVANPDTSETLRNTADTITVLTNDTATSALTPGSVTVTTQPADGTAVAQADGTIVYTPTTGFVGTDTFDYTVEDAALDTSAPAAVTVTVVAPAPPSAVNDNTSATQATADTIDVLANDTAAVGTLTGAVIVTPPTNGTAVAQANGTVVYTPNAGYLGADSFTYNAVDSLGDSSTVPATVAISVTAAAPPVANADTASTLSGQAVSVDVLANDTSVAVLKPSSVAVSTAPLDGTATVDADGTISYTPTAGFVGSDQFSYTVGDTNNQTSAAANVVVNVGTELSSAKGGSKTLRFTDAAGGAQIVSLNVGTADIYFTGSGKVAAAKGVTTLTGTGLNISTMTLAGTTRASVLSVRGSVVAPVTIGGLTDSAPLGTVVASSATLEGTITLAGVNTLGVGALSGATVTTGGASGTHLALTSGLVTDTDLTSAVPITTLRVSNWTQTVSNSITTTIPTVYSVTAPAIGNLVSNGAFSPDISLTGVLTAARIGGNLTSANVQAASVRTLRVGGAMTDVNLKTTSAAATSFGTLTVGGSITTSVISSAGSIAGIVAATLTDSEVYAGTSASTLADVTADNVGSATIRSLRFNSRSANGFSGSTVIAGTIGVANLDAIDRASLTAPNGLAAKSIKTLIGTLTGTPFHLTAAELASQTSISAALAKQGVTFGTFMIALV